MTPVVEIGAEVIMTTGPWRNDAGLVIDRDDRGRIAVVLETLSAWLWVEPTDVAAF